MQINPEIKKRIAIFGVSGLVGKEILTSFNLLNVNFNQLRLYSSSISAGTIINFRDIDYVVQEFQNHYLNDFDYCILAVDNEIARNIIEYARLHQLSCIIIDNSSDSSDSDDSDSDSEILS